MQQKSNFNDSIKSKPVTSKKIMVKINQHSSFTAFSWLKIE